MTGQKILRDGDGNDDSDIVSLRGDVWWSERSIFVRRGLWFHVL